MTVAQLIDELKKMPQDLVVWTEGCDCTAEARDVSVEHSKDQPDIVMISRER